VNVRLCLSRCDERRVTPPPEVVVCSRRNGNGGNGGGSGGGGGGGGADKENWRRGDNGDNVVVDVDEGGVLSDVGRRMHVVFAPHLPRASAAFTVQPSGVRGVAEETNEYDFASYAAAKATYIS
jgi:hypothetical protein